jgi:molecular chaperone Hsp33
MCQRLPAPDQGDEAEDDWRRTVSLVASARDSELLDPALPADRLLYRLLHEDGVRVHPHRAVLDQCRCSRERVVQTLRSIGPANLDEFKVEGRIVVTCEFCNASYPFDEAALAAL